jgi:hypothetical protein
MLLLLAGVAGGASVTSATFEIYIRVQLPKIAVAAD